MSAEEPHFMSFEPKPFAGTNALKPIKVGKCELQNRIVLPPLTRVRADINGVPDGKLSGEYYSQRGQSPGTLLITEAVSVSKQASGFDHTPGLYSEEQVEQWKIVTDAVHSKKSYVFAQLWATGRAGNPASLARDGLRYDSASDDVYLSEDIKEAALKAKNPQHGITKEEIKEYVANFAKAAKNAVAAGFDGVELHAANGYLVDQFLDPATNHRTDEYGGSIENRARFALEIIDAMVEAIGAERVAVRLSPFGRFQGMSGSKNPLFLAQHAYIIGELERRGQEGKRLAFIDLVEARLPNLFTEELDGKPTDSSDFIYTVWEGIVVRSGNFGTHPDVALKVFENERTLLAYGRVFISNPDLVYRLEKGLPLNQYNRSTFYGGGAVGYTDYPTYEEAVAKGYKVVSS